MKKFLKTFSVGLILLTVISSNTFITKAAQIDNLIYQWDHVFKETNINGIYHVHDYVTNQKYRTITFTNGYSYTDTYQDVASMWDKLTGIYQRLQYTRTYRTY